MNIAEYQAKIFFKQYSIPVLDSKVAKNSKEAFEAAKTLGGGVFAVKAQVLAGGRGKGGGVKIVQSPKEAEQVAGSLLGSYLVTPQTSKQGELVSKVLIEKGCDIKKEYYLAALLDPICSQIIFMASPEGGMDIEEVSEKSPEKILKIKIRPDFGFEIWQAWDIGNFLGFSKKEEIKQIFSLCQNLYQLLLKKMPVLLKSILLFKHSKENLSP